MASCPCRTGALGLYSVSFFHASETCSNTSRAMSVYGKSIPADFTDKCRYAETLKDDGSLRSSILL